MLLTELCKRQARRARLNARRREVADDIYRCLCKLGIPGLQILRGQTVDLPKADSRNDRSGGRQCLSGERVLLPDAGLGDAGSRGVEVRRSEVVRLAH